jgi:hypothetical protein
MENRANEYAHIKGWGIDADVKNDPTYPMKHRTDEEQLGYSWERPPLQPVDVEILKSVERPNLTAVFGTSTPPKGLSGMIRRYAFKFSENDYNHWLPLLLADRINVVEGIVEDLSHGHIPNTFAEKGGKAVWKYNKTEILVKVAAAAVITAGVIAWFRDRKSHQLEDIREYDY